MSSKRSNEDSGLVDLDAMLKQSATPAPVAAAPPPVVAPAPARAVGPSTPDDSLSAVAADAKKKSLPPPAVVPVKAPVTQVTEVALPSRKGRRLVVVVAVAAAALAVFAVSRVARAPVVTQAPVAITAVKATMPAATVVVAPQASPTGVDPASLPTVAADAPAPKVVAAHVATAPKAEPATPVAEPKITEKALAPSAPSDPSDLGAAMQSAVGSRTEAHAEESKNAGDPNARQVRPSPGAVIGAMNAVLPAARACLGPDGAMRSGTLVFKSDGTVGNVALKGAKNEDECVRGALAKARVQPFSDASFTTGFTVRP